MGWKVNKNFLISIGKRIEIKILRRLAYQSCNTQKMARKIFKWKIFQNNIYIYPHVTSLSNCINNNIPKKKKQTLIPNQLTNV